MSLNICAFGPPTNDLCTNATSLSVGLETSCSNIGGTNSGTTDSSELPTPSCAAYSGRDAWFSVTVPQSGVITVETSGASGLTESVMSVYSGPCGALTEIECYDDDRDGFFSMITLMGQTPGEVLLVRVWEFENTTIGEFNICAYDAERDCQANVGSFGKFRNIEKSPNTKI